MEQMVLSRKVYLYGEISQESEKSIVQSIHAINDYDDYYQETYVKHVREPIIIFIGSDGGDLFSGLGIRAAIRESITPVITVVNGLAASAGFLIFISGHLRVMSDEAFLMSHSLATGGGHLEKVNDTWEKLERVIVLKDLVDRIVKESTTEDFDFKNYQEEIYEKKKDIYYTAADALKYGFTDVVTNFDEPLQQFIDQLLNGEIEFETEEEDENDEESGQK